MKWYEVKDGDPRAVAIYRRHYSAKKTNHGQRIDYCRYGFSGKGESMILLTQDCGALFGWRFVKGEGANCFVFRREFGVLASDLIKEANQLAYDRWGNVRLYTYVDPKEVKGDGLCFKKAGYKKLPGRTKKNKLICLEIKPSAFLQQGGGREEGT